MQSLERPGRRLTSFRWHSLAMGRQAALKMGDITCRFPVDEPALVSLCEIARVAEENAEIMYLRKSESLRMLCTAAEKTHAQLRHIAEQANLASSPRGDKCDPPGSLASLHLHNCMSRPIVILFGTNSVVVYYHAVLLTFRPFLVAEALVPQHQKLQLMWLREACRHAVNAAQDSLVYISTSFASSEACKVCSSPCYIKRAYLARCRASAQVFNNAY